MPKTYGDAVFAARAFVRTRDAVRCRYDRSHRRSWGRMKKMPDTKGNALRGGGSHEFPRRPPDPAYLEDAGRLAGQLVVELDDGTAHRANFKFR